MNETQRRFLLTVIGTLIAGSGLASIYKDAIFWYLLIAFLGSGMFAIFLRSGWGIPTIPMGYAIGITFDELIVQAGADMSLTEAVLAVLAAAFGAAITTAILAVRQRNQEPTA